FVDVRLIFACNRNLIDLVENSTFRDDLFYRLEGNIIHLPPLRERENDIITLTEYFCNKFANKHRCSFAIDCSSLESELQSYSWPGNVRELKKFIEYLFVMYDKVDNKVIINELHAKKSNQHLHDDNYLSNLLELDDFTEVIETLEKKYIEHQLELYDNKINVVASKMKIDRTTLYKKIKKYKLKNS
ncbi:MAG TPA: helix-turn-helix domain-containing protein, partial [Candidatus Cloacimonadota bacterium]|nr:helix-turn-helix domain-containing protein [Candidatus Cloacimonadota bacterium]